MKNLESKIYDVLKEAGVPVKQAKKMAKKTAQKAEFFIWEKKQGEDKNGIPKKETELDRAVDKAVDAAIDAVSDSKLGKLLDENMAELFGPEMGKMISRVENKVDDSVITPRPKAGVVTRLKMNLCSPSLSVSESGNEELCSELSPSLVEADKRSRKAECSTPQGLTNDDKVGVQSVDGVSDNSPLPARYHTTGECSPYDGSQDTSSNHQTAGQPDCSGSDCLQQTFPDGKPGRGLPSIDDMSENGADEDVPAVSRMEEKKKINNLYDTIYREISLTPDEEEFVANIKNAAAEADAENMDASDRAEIFCSLLKRNVNPRRLVKVKDVLNLKYYSFAKERQYEPVGKLLKEFEKYCFLQMPISEQLKTYYGANKPFYQG